MTKKPKPIGHCRICGKQGPLSEEHVPPRAAYNNARVVEYQLVDMVTKKRGSGKIRQGGVRFNTLCEQCNNDTGSWYGSEYVGWAKTCFSIIESWEQGGKRHGTVTLFDVYPLRFLKQVVTCFFSVIDQYGKGAYAQSEPELVKFVLDKYEQSLPPNHNYFLSLYPFSAKTNTQLRRYPLAGKIRVAVDSSGKVRPLSARAFSEFTNPPFALTTMPNTTFSGATNITYFQDYKYDESVDLSLDLSIVESSSPYPGATGWDRR